MIEKPGHQSDAVAPTHSGARVSGHRHWRRSAGVVAVFALLVVGAYFARDFFKRLGPPERCWEIWEVAGHLYKANPCTGQFVLLGDAPATPKDR